MAFAMYGLTTRTPVTGMVVIAVSSRAKMPPTLVVIGARLSWTGMNALILTLAQWKFHHGLRTDIAILMMTTIAKHVTGMEEIVVKIHARMASTPVGRVSSARILDIRTAFRKNVRLTLLHGLEMDTVTTTSTRAVAIGMVVIVVVQRAKVPNCTNVDTTRTICLLDLTVTILTSCPSLTMLAWT
jgi:hypothetical protein